LRPEQPGLAFWENRMTVLGMTQLGISTVVFLLAASAAKAWTLAPTNWRLILVLALYSIGNLIMLRLIRDFGMGVALSLSAVIQLVAVNVVAFAWFGERVDTLQGVGIVIAIAAVALITLGPYLTAR
jgi:multidrug transporter EmrE-like cation transporter